MLKCTSCFVTIKPMCTQRTGCFSIRTDAQHDLPSLTCIMTSCQTFVSLTSYFLIRTLQDDLRAMQIELKGCESCLNVSVTGWCGYNLLQWTCTHDFYLNLAFFKRAFSCLDIMTAPAPAISQTCCSNAICTKDSCWRVFIGNLNWPRKWVFRVSSLWGGWECTVPGM